MLLNLNNTTDVLCEPVELRLMFGVVTHRCPIVPDLDANVLLIGLLAFFRV